MQCPFHKETTNKNTHGLQCSHCNLIQFIIMTGFKCSANFSKRPEPDKQIKRFSLVETHLHYKALNLSINQQKAREFFHFFFLPFSFLLKKTRRVKINELKSAKIEVFYKALYFRLALCLASVQPARQSS